MKLSTILVTLCFVATIHARAEVSHIPSGSYLPGTGGGYSHHGGTIGSFGSSFGHFGGDFGGSGSFQGGGGFGGSSIGNGGFFGGQGGGGGLSQDQRSVYFFAAPDSGEQQRLRIVVAPSGTRNTKVIFIKAPSYGSIKPEIVAPPSHTEDKTLVYVLVKRPQDGGSITIPTTLTSNPTKPQVYFINYNNQQEAERAITGGLHEHAVGPSIQDLGSKQAFVGTIKDNASGGIGGIHREFGHGGVYSGFGGSSSSFGSSGSSFGGGSIGGGSKYGPPTASGPY